MLWKIINTIYENIEYDIIKTRNINYNLSLFSLFSLYIFFK